MSIKCLALALLLCLASAGLGLSQQASKTPAVKDPEIIDAAGYQKILDQYRGKPLLVKFAPELAGDELKAVVGFHSGLATSAPSTKTNAMKARILVCIGADDPMIPPEQRAAFESEVSSRVRTCTPPGYPEFHAAIR